MIVRSGGALEHEQFRPQVRRQPSRRDNRSGARLAGCRLVKRWVLSAVLAQRHRFVQQRPRVVEPPLCDGDDPQPELCERGEPGAVRTLREVAAFAQVAQGLCVGASARLQGAGGDERGGIRTARLERSCSTESDASLSASSHARVASRRGPSPAFPGPACVGTARAGGLLIGKERPPASEPPGLRARRFPELLGVAVASAARLTLHRAPLDGLRGSRGWSGSGLGRHDNFILRPSASDDHRRRPRQPARSGTPGAAIRAAARSPSYAAGADAARDRAARSRRTRSLRVRCTRR